MNADIEMLMAADAEARRTVETLRRVPQAHVAAGFSARVMAEVRAQRRRKGLSAPSVFAAAASLVAFCHRPVPTVYGPPPLETDDPGINIAETVYGPPPDHTFEPWDNVPPPVYGPPPFDPENNFPEDVYGPPVEFDERDEEEAGPGEEFDPSEPVPEAVYGPPEDLGWD